MRSRRQLPTTTRPDRVPCGFLPPYLLRRLAQEGVGSAERTLLVDGQLRGARVERPGVRAALTADAGPWLVHTADNATTLPGRRVRGPGEADTGDAAVDEAAAGIEATLAMFAEAFGRDGFDGAGATALLTVHYGTDYANAFWDGAQLVFGDGDGAVLDRFTKPVDVLAHEFTHAVVEHTAGLEYAGQSGALNESVSDAFAACLKQRVLGQDAAGADWLIGEGLFLPGVQARALRDMAAPGTAYDDPRLGTDPQVGHLDDYVETTDDNGGVHLNSGIPNRAFQLAAVAIGGDSLAGAGAIWYAALTSASVGPRADFATFAAATVAAAGPHEQAVREAWAQVGLTPGASAPAPAPAQPGAGRVVRVSRSGGFAGITESYEADLAGDAPGIADVRSALARVEAEHALAPPPASPGHPDQFTYRFEVDDRPAVAVPERHLTEPLRDLADAVRRCSRDDR